jgi:hypothetical protein
MNPAVASAAKICDLFIFFVLLLCNWITLPQAGSRSKTDGGSTTALFTNLSYWQYYPSSKCVRDGEAILQNSNGASRKRTSKSSVVPQAVPQAGQVFGSVIYSGDLTGLHSSSDFKIPDPSHD